MFQQLSLKMKANVATKFRSSISKVIQNKRVLNLLGIKDDNNDDNKS